MVEPAFPAQEFGALPESIPLPPDSRDHLLRREAFLLLFCAAFAGTVFLLWAWFSETLLREMSPSAHKATHILY